MKMPQPLDAPNGILKQASVTLSPNPERKLIRPGSCHRHVDFQLAVVPAARTSGPSRVPVRLALVLDRSGSMTGGKLDLAKRAALLALDRLGPEDVVAVVAFDDKIDVIQSAAPASPAVKAGVRAALATIQPRASTALHEGWLVGASEIASRDRNPANLGVSR